MGTHPIFESDFDCLTEDQIMAVGKLMSVIAEEDTVTGFLLGGVGQLDKERNSNFLICDAKTEASEIESALRGFLARSDIGIVLITQDYAEQVRHVIETHSAPIPTILEIPSKEKPYDPEKDTLLKRAKDMFGGEG